jgi:hypothetical protein
MLKFLFLFFLLIPSIPYASSLDDLKKLTNEPLYFSAPIQSYEMVEKGSKTNLKVRLSPYSITVITDRPYRKKTTIKPDEFIDYILEKREKDLVFTLSLQKKGHPFLINFKKQNAHFSSNINEVVFEDIQIPKNVSEQFGEAKGIKGTDAILIVEG